MNLLSRIESEDNDFAVSIYIDEERNLSHFWVRAGMALLNLETIEDVDTLIELLQEARTDAQDWKKGTRDE